MNILFVTARRKARQAAEAFATIGEGWESRKENRPENNAVDMATEIGIELLTEEEYRLLQQLGNFDTKTSSWLKAPPEV